MIDNIFLTLVMYVWKWFDFSRYPTFKVSSIRVKIFIYITSYMVQTIESHYSINLKLKDNVKKALELFIFKTLAFIYIIHVICTHIRAKWYWFKRSPVGLEKNAYFMYRPWPDIYTNDYICSRLKHKNHNI